MGVWHFVSRFHKPERLLQDNVYLNRMVNWRVALTRRLLAIEAFCHHLETRLPASNQEIEQALLRWPDLKQFLDEQKKFGLRCILLAGTDASTSVSPEKSWYFEADTMGKIPVTDKRPLLPVLTAFLPGNRKGDELAGWDLGRDPIWQSILPERIPPSPLMLLKPVNLPPIGQYTPLTVTVLPIYRPADKAAFLLFMIWDLKRFFSHPEGMSLAQIIGDHPNQHWQFTSATPQTSASSFVEELPAYHIKFKLFLYDLKPLAVQRMAPLPPALLCAVCVMLFCLFLRQRRLTAITLDHASQRLAEEREEKRQVATLRDSAVNRMTRLLQVFRNNVSTLLDTEKKIGITYLVWDEATGKFYHAVTPDGQQASFKPYDLAYVSQNWLMNETEAQEFMEILLTLSSNDPVSWQWHMDNDTLRHRFQCVIYPLVPLLPDNSRRKFIVIEDNHRAIQAEHRHKQFLA
ncbi:MAG: hypothetical protein D6820_06710, partial [Lentisphaerae bacterium]